MYGLNEVKEASLLAGQGRALNEPTGAAKKRHQTSEWPRWGDPTGAINIWQTGCASRGVPKHPAR